MEMEIIKLSVQVKDLSTRYTSSKTSFMILTYFGPGRCEGLDRFTEKLVSRLFLIGTLLFSVFVYRQPRNT